MDHNLLAFITGVTTSLTAIYTNVLVGRPRLAVSTEIAYDKRYRIKLLNKSRIWGIYNISIFEFYRIANDNYYAAQIKPIPYLERWKRKQNVRGVAAVLKGPVRIVDGKSRIQDIAEFLNEDESNCVEIVILCSSRWGGIKGVFKQKYPLSALKKGYRFVDTSVQTCKI